MLVMLGHALKWHALNPPSSTIDGLPEVPALHSRRLSLYRTPVELLIKKDDVVFQPDDSSLGLCPESSEFRWNLHLTSLPSHRLASAL